MTTTEVKISDIKANPNNPRLIKDEKFLRLVESVKSFPEMLRLRPIVVNEDNVIIGGNMRWKAAKEAGYKTVPVTKAVGLTEEQQREFIIKDNVGFGEWDWEMLANEWDARKLEKWGLEITDVQIEPEIHDDEYEISNEIETDIVIGDLFEIGQHRLLCGDSIEADAMALLMNGTKSDMVFTDPPYNVNYGKIKYTKRKGRDIENDNMSKNDYIEFCRAFISNIVINNRGCIYMAGPPGPDGRIMFTEADKALHCSTVIVWNKNQFTLGRGKYQNKYEPIWFGWPETITFPYDENHELIWFGWENTGDTFNGDRKQTNVWDFDRPKHSAEHPTMKPIELVGQAIIHASKHDQIVLDLFLGSGSTMVAAHQLNRKCYGMELDPKYCQVIVDRMHKLDPSLEIKRNGQPYKIEN